jgi:hypothetical protein
MRVSSVANIIVVESAKPEVEIGFRDYLRAGVPITLATLLVGVGVVELGEVRSEYRVPSTE